MWVEAIVAAAMATGLAACPDSDVTNPDWLVKPSPLDFAWAYPDGAADEGLSAVATIHCELTIDGLPENCIVVAEEPRGRGFGEAALRMSKLMRFTPKKLCGTKVRAKVQIPLRFEPPDGVVEVDVSPENAALARRLIAATGQEEQLNDRFEQELQVAYGVYDGDGKLSIDHRSAAFHAARETWATAKEAVLEPIVSSYAARLSTEDLQAAVEFYESPTGQRLALQHRRQIVLSLSPVITPELVEDFRKRYCARVLPCGPEPIDKKR